jgi:dihydrodipicolinate synthase/N-acetylneuraminate lyase
MRYRQGILVSCQVPWGDRERFLEESFREQVRYYIRSGYRDMYIFGTAGEGHAVDTQRFVRVAKVFREETQTDGVWPMVGVIGLSTATIVERIGLAHDLGFRTFQISLPSWGALNDTELFRFFTDVCAAYPDSRFLHYNLPRSRRILTAPEYRRIADAVPNLVATKNTGTTVASTIELMKHAGDLQHFFGESMFPTGCAAGECSLLSSFGAFAPLKTRQFFELGRLGRLEQLIRMQHEYLTMAAAVQEPTRGKSLMDGAYDKMWVRLAGLDMPLRLLSPYESFPEEVFDQCRRVFYEQFSEWAAGNRAVTQSA